MTIVDVTSKPLHTVNQVNAAITEARRRSDNAGAVSEGAREFFELVRNWCKLSPELKRSILDLAKSEV